MNIPAERILWERWEQYGDFRTAFLSWAEDLTRGYDEYRARPRDPVIDLDPQVTACGLADGQVAELRRELLPIYGNGTTLRKLAHALDVHPYVVTAAIYNGNGKRYDSYMRLEEELLASGPPNQRGEDWATLNRRYGFNPTSRVAQRVAETHGIPLGTQQSRAHPFRAEAEELMLGERMSPHATRVRLQKRYPNEPRVQKLTDQTLRVWRSRAQARDRRSA